MGDVLTSELGNCLPIFLDRLRNEITRLTAVKAVTSIAGYVRLLSRIFQNLNVDLIYFMACFTLICSSFYVLIACHFIT